MKFIKYLFAAALFSGLPLLAFGQKAETNRFKRTTTKTERIDLGAGGKVTMTGAPVGAISIEGWRERTVEITADISVEASSREDLELLSKVSSFTADADANHIRIISTGTNDRDFLKKNFKKFPKHLLNLPWRIDYRIKVPILTDLDINAGRGNFDLNLVEGFIVIKSLEAETANLSLTGGSIQATFGTGNINLKINSRSFRGLGGDIQLAKGEMNVVLPSDMNADFDADILRTGEIENLFDNLKPRDRTKFTQTKMQARSGVGGAKFIFTVGDGRLRLMSDARSDN
jgi:hypothetical protein